MKLYRVFIVVAVMTLLALLTVWQQMQTTRLGYKIEEIEQKKQRLLEEQRQLCVEVSRLGAPDALTARAEKLGIKLTQPSEVSVVKVSGGNPAGAFAQITSRKREATEATAVKGQ